MKVLFFISLCACAACSYVGFAENIVAPIGCISALIFAILVFRDIYRAWKSA
jgi:hypothetical protein